VPFDHTEWLFELKYDGFRSLAVIEHGRARLISRNGHPFASFVDLGTDIGNALPNTGLTVLDGEICSLDRRVRPQFRNLLFRGNPPCFFAFDLLMGDGKDYRTERLSDRKQELRRLLAQVTADSLKYTEYIEGSGTALFELSQTLGRTFSLTQAKRAFRRWRRFMAEEQTEPAASAVTANPAAQLRLTLWESRVMAG
jgi:bifunctional non-homologous end joining protein LigD